MHIGSNGLVSFLFIYFSTLSAGIAEHYFCLLLLPLTVVYVMVAAGAGLPLQATNLAVFIFGRVKQG
jgi:hypothetical protein